MRTVYREKKYTCGEYLDVFIYPVFETGKPGGGKRTKRKPSTKAQEKLNQKHRKEKLTRMLHANFTPEDLELHGTYEVQPENDEEALRDRANYIRSVKRYAKKNNLGEVKYIGVTERGKRGGRYHHHFTIHVEKGIDRDVLEKLWTKTEGHGYANTKRLQFSEKGLAGLGAYISKSPIGYRAWTASRNLVDPEPVTRDGRISGRKAKELAEKKQDSTQFETLYPGYLASSPAEALYNDVNGGFYLFLRLYRKDGKFIKPKKRKGGKKTWEELSCPAGCAPRIARR